jgi:prepilin-type N-terminal cleavage/methylation domain-containing protein
MRAPTRPARRWRTGRGDDGFTLMEIMVGSALMSVVMAVATAGFVDMFHTADRTEANTLTETNLMMSFSRLDREVRYAYRVNQPYMPNTDTFAIDYVIPDNTNTLQCVQLTLPVAGGALLRKVWPQNGTSATGVTNGVASSLVSASTTVSNGATVTANPFSVLTSGQGNSNFDRLQLNMNSTFGVSDKGSTRNYNLQFTALNTLDLTNNLTCVKA